MKQLVKVMFPTSSGAGSIAGTVEKTFYAFFMTVLQYLNLKATPHWIFALCTMQR